MNALAWRVWWRIGCMSFGGPAGQIAMMQRILVDELRWLDQRHFLTALSFCMLLPGPEAQQLATYIGWQRSGWRGALVAGGLFVLPGMLVMLALCLLYVLFGRYAPVEAILLGVKCAVVVIVVEALIRIGKRALVFPSAWLAAALALVALHLFALPYPLIVVCAGALGWLLAGPVQRDDSDVATFAPLPTQWRLVLLTGLAWLAPLIVLMLVAGRDFLATQLALLYSGLAVVSFGGAYALLAYLSEVAVASYGWLSAAQMADGLGLAESTPGPLVLVLQFVAFLAAYQQAGGGSLWSAAIVSLFAMWFLFVPSFFWIFLGGPHVERIHRNYRLRHALALITAAVVGVIAHLSIWFALHVWFADVDWREWASMRVLWPDWGSVRWLTIALTALAAGLMFVLRRGLLFTLISTAGAGLLLNWLT